MNLQDDHGCFSGGVHAGVRLTKRRREVEAEGMGSEGVRAGDDARFNRLIDRVGADGSDVRFLAVVDRVGDDACDGGGGGTVADFDDGDVVFVCINSLKFQIHRMNTIGSTYQVKGVLTPVT